MWLLFFSQISYFHIFSILFGLFLWFFHLFTTLLVLIFCLCAVCFLFSVFMWCLFYSGWKINFEHVYIQSMTLTSSTLPILSYEYSIHLNIFIFVNICTLSFYAINIVVVSLFINSTFLIFATLNLYCIDVLYQFEWISFKKKLIVTKK